MKKSILNSSTSTRVLTLIGAVMLGLSLMSANSFADDDQSDRDRPKQCNKKRDGHKRHGKDLSHVRDMLDKKLDLTEDQKTSISQVIDQYNPELKQLQEQMREGKKAERKLVKQDNFDEAAINKQAQQNADLMVKMIVLKAKAKHEIHSNLTDDQKSKIQKMFEKRHQKRMKKDSEGNA
ncbi:MAG: Spy/CpxP family protein refolding chaperone [Proteobacteria bacterium]|nr:periplasmic heavy metal sensor [Pseudomonadota bacterium]NOG59008.1 Spy/CpxP family protein refolding chaperone [Pseudomonadota bacterium]